MSRKLLEVEGLTTRFSTAGGEVDVIENVTFSIDAGETVGLVGESGSGKSVTALSILGLIKPPGRIASGSIRLDGTELVGMPDRALRSIRGKDISMIFQEPMTSLNPVLTVGEQIAEVVRLHQGLNRRDAWLRAIDMLRQVGIPSPEERVRQYPHQLSGGMRQRVMIAIALACRPKLLIADEPTTALDVTIQAQILELMRQLNREYGMGILLVTHDLGVVAQMCSRVIVLYAGQIVEQGPTEEMFRSPKHPYTEALLKSIPVIGERASRLYSIPGSIPAPGQQPQGCRFHPRCAYAVDLCRRTEPGLFRLPDGTGTAKCWKHADPDEAADADGRKEANGP
jgi:oligopeptide/dipeptide ABC transporter ATP-binding protein